MTVTLGSAFTLTDSGGNFVLLAPPPGANMLLVDGYDGNGNLLTVTDARGSTITHTYDPMDRLATRIDQLGASESFSYDPSGNLTGHTDRKGQVATFTYDGLNRRTGASYADGTTTSFSYDAAGRLVQASDSVGGTIQNQYDSLDRLIAQASGLGTISYQYDALGRRTSMLAAGQASVTYGYDAASRLTTITQAAQLVQLQYDAAGRRTRLTLPNGVSTEYQYDTASRLAALIYRNAAGPLGDLSYQYDAAGNRIGVGGSFARTLLPDTVATTSYDAANRQIAFSDKQMTFDANGNLTLITEPSGLKTFSWDARNRLAGVQDGTTTAAFVYDASGRRVVKRINDAITQYIYDGLDVTQQVDNAGATSYLRSLAIDEALGTGSSAGSFFLLADGLGSTLAATGGAGGIATEYRYDPFGVTASTDPTVPNPFQFTGRENDGLAGLYSYRARYYQPALHRFLSEDPFRFTAGDANFYVYVLNSPLVFTDPFGEIPPPLASALVGGVIGATVGGLSYVINNGPNNLSATGFLISTGVGFGQGFVGGLGLGGNTFVSALVGAGIGVGADIASQLLTSNSQGLDVNSIVIAGIAGAIGGAGANLAIKGGASAGTAAGVGGSLAAGVEVGLRLSAPGSALAATPALSGRK